METTSTKVETIIKAKAHFYANAGSFCYKRGLINIQTQARCKNKSYKNEVLRRI